MVVVMVAEMEVAMEVETAVAMCCILGAASKLTESTRSPI